MPPGIEISDSMSYSTIDLGIIGDVISDTVKAATGKDSFKSSLEASLSTFTDKTIGKIKSTNAAAAASIAAKYSGMEGIANSINFGAKQIIAPNTNTTFQGSNIRSYPFRFKMVARNKAESDVVKQIVSSFRQYLYPKGNDLLLEFPGTWLISFVYGSNESAKNSYIPEPYRCYLTSFSSTYNSSNNMWHDDGAPVEVDIAMNFQEVKALNQSQITVLDRQAQPQQQ
jgi:hypothetical protein